MTLRFSAICISGLLGLTAPALAQDTNADTSAASSGTFHLELNKARETDSGNCRLTYVAQNDSDVALDRTEYEVVIFDADLIVSRQLVLKFGALVPGKTRVLEFELPGTACSDISKIVINDVSACIDAVSGADSGFCFSGLNPSSRTEIEFGI